MLMRLSTLFLRTMRDDPADAEVSSGAGWLTAWSRPATGEAVNDATYRSTR